MPQLSGHNEYLDPLSGVSYCGGPQLPTKDTTIKGEIRGKGRIVYPVNAYQTF